MKVTLIEKIFNVKVYPCFMDATCLSADEFKRLNDEMRELAVQCFGSVPEYQCFKKDAVLNDKLIIIHRNKDGKLIALSSSVIIKSDSVKEIFHLGIYLVSPFHRHHYLPLKLGLATVAAYMLCSPLRHRYWMTNLSSVLGVLAMVDKMYLDVYPSLKVSKPKAIHKIIANEFQNGVIERCYISKDSKFDDEKFIYRNANKKNCFLKKSNDKKFHSLNNKYNNFYMGLMDVDEGDAILQVGCATHFYLLKAIMAYIYRIVIRDKICRCNEKKTLRNI